MRTFALRAAVAALSLALVGTLASPPAFANNMSRKSRIRVMRGVVKILVLKRVGGRYVRVGHGSGTVLNKQGLILTNNHVLQSSRSGRLWDALAVAPTTSFRSAPKAACLAFPHRATRSRRLDLALIKCEREMNGAKLRSRVWHPVKIGSSKTLVPGDALFIVGYPTIGGGEITFSSGEVSGFTRNYKGRWIKTTAMIGKGVSGGGAFNAKGELVGVPTLQRWRRNERVVLGLARPIASAHALIRQVSRGWAIAARRAELRNGGGRYYANRWPRATPRGWPRAAPPSWPRARNPRDGGWRWPAMPRRYSRRAPTPRPYTRRAPTPRRYTRRAPSPYAPPSGPRARVAPPSPSDGGWRWPAMPRGYRAPSAPPSRGWRAPSPQRRRAPRRDYSDRGMRPDGRGGQPQGFPLARL